VHRGRLRTSAGEAPRPTLRRPPLKTLVLRWFPGLPVVLAIGLTAWIVSHFSRIIHAVKLNPDAAFAPVLIADLRTGTKGGLTLVGEASHLTAIAFVYLTRGFPFRNVFWDWGPYVTFLIGLGIGAWACWRVAGPWAAAMVFSVGACAEASVLLTVMSEGIRGHTFFAVAVMCALLVAMVQRPDMPRARRVAVVVVAVLVAGSTVASDPLFLAVGLGPLVGASLLVWLLRRDGPARSVAMFSLVTAGGAMIVSQLIWAAVRAMGFKKNYLETGYDVVKPSQLWPNVRVFLRHVLTLTHAAPLTHPSRATPAELAMTLVIVGVTVYAVSLLYRLGRRPPTTAAEPAGTALLTYTAFWTLSGLGVLAAFALSSFSAGPSDTSRYVIPVFFALAAVGPLWGRRLDWRRPVAAGCVTLFCLASIAARRDLFMLEQFPGFASVHRNGPALISFLEGRGLKYGYGGYFTSHQLTLMSDLRVYTYPVIACRTPASDIICPLFVNVRTAWYVPRPGVRSFLLQDSSVPESISPGPSKSLGRPSEVRTFGTMTVYLFDYDIASRFSPPCIDPGVFFCPAASSRPE
jgi:hypothetical protein